jgi:thiol-disulfide isomerase/thioredoxin
MKQFFILGILYCMVVAVLSMPFALTRLAKVIAANPKTAHAAIAPQSKQQDSVPDADSESDDEADAHQPIRFASNPEPMPPFLVNDVDGDVISTAQWRGKVVIVNFWATWCPPCREEIPEMIDLATRYRDRLQIVGVSEDDDATPQEIRAFAHNEKMNYPIVMGSGGISKEYGGVPALPTSFLVDTNGRVVQKHVGLYPTSIYDHEIRALLGEHIDVPVETFIDEGQIFLKNAANATELPGVDFSKLTPAQKRVALKRMNSENCICGCKLTIAQCRINDSSCSISQKLAAQIVKQVSASHPSVASAGRKPAS